jgi:hypothetical protein
MTVISFLRTSNQPIWLSNIDPVSFLAGHTLSSPLGKEKCESQRVVCTVAEVSFNLHGRFPRWCVIGRKCCRPAADIYAAHSWAWSFCDESNCRGILPVWRHRHRKAAAGFLKTIHPENAKSESHCRWSQNFSLFVTDVEVVRTGNLFRLYTLLSTNTRALPHYQCSLMWQDPVLLAFFGSFISIFLENLDLAGHSKWKIVLRKTVTVRLAKLCFLLHTNAISEVKHSSFFLDELASDSVNGQLCTQCSLSTHISHDLALKIALAKYVSFDALSSPRQNAVKGKNSYGTLHVTFLKAFVSLILLRLMNPGNISTTCGRLQALESLSYSSLWKSILYHPLIQHSNWRQCLKAILRRRWMVRLVTCFRIVLHNVQHLSLAQLARAPISILVRVDQLSFLSCQWPPATLLIYSATD